MQGVGALGVAGVAGNALVSADDGSAAVQQDQTAFRVAHASPDAPSVDVTLRAADGGGGGTPDGGGTATTVGGDGPLIEGLEFSDVSSYNEVEPGSYQLRIIATESTGFLEGLFGDAEQRVVYEDEIELEGGTTYTAVAYGELAEADLDEPVTATETPGIGGETETETETDDGAGVGGETPTDSGATPTDEGDGVGQETPTDETETPGIGGETETETDAGGAGDGQVVVDQLSFGEHQSFTIEPGDYTLEFRETTATGGDTTGTETPEDDGIGQETPTETETDGIGGDETPTETETDGLGGDETPTETDGAMGGEGSDRAFTVAVLEDDLSAPEESAVGADGTPTGGETPDGTPTDDGGVIGDETETPGESPAGQETETDGANATRVRVFHAVPDVDAMEIVAVEGGGGGLFGGGDGDDETETPVPTDGGVGGEQEQTPTAEGTETDSDDGASVREAEISPEGGSVYSGFAVGYFDPAAAGTDVATPADDGTPVGAVQTETETAPAETATGTDEEIVEEGNEEFQFVTVEDSSDGERSDGGTGGGGILPDQSAPPAASD